MLGHFVLDDLFYWFGLMGIVEQNHPQIFWLYPFDPRYEPALQWAQENFLNQGLNRVDILFGYIEEATPVFILEIAFLIAAVWVWVRNLKNVILKKNAEVNKKKK